MKHKIFQISVNRILNTDKALFTNLMAEKLIHLCISK